MRIDFLPRISHTHGGKLGIGLSNSEIEPDERYRECG